MSETSKAVKADSYTLANMLTVLFVGLKLTGNLSWSWVWVTSPVWICYALAFLILFVVGLVRR